MVWCQSLCCGPFDFSVSHSPLGTSPNIFSGADKDHSKPFLVFAYYDGPLCHTEKLLVGGTQSLCGEPESTGSFIITVRK